MTWITVRNPIIPLKKKVNKIITQEMNFRKPAFVIRSLRKLGMIRYRMSWGLITPSSILERPIMVLNMIARRVDSKTKSQVMNSQ